MKRLIRSAETNRPLNLDRFIERIKLMYDKTNSEIESISDYLAPNGKLVQSGQEFEKRCNAIYHALDGVGRCVCFNSVGILAAALDYLGEEYKICIGIRTDENIDDIVDHIAIVTHCWVEYNGSVYQTNQVESIPESKAKYYAVVTADNVGQL